MKFPKVPPGFEGRSLFRLFCVRHEDACNGWVVCSII